jgi:hypothetical protein
MMKMNSINILVISAMVVFSLMLITTLSKSYEEKTINDIPLEKDSINRIDWIPTKEDIAYQDSMWTIIEQTQLEVDTIKESIEHILLRLEYMDGTSDSIRITKKK